MISAIQEKFSCCSYGQCIRHHLLCRSSCCQKLILKSIVICFGLVNVLKIDVVDHWQFKPHFTSGNGLLFIMLKKSRELAWHSAFWFFFSFFACPPAALDDLAENINRVARSNSATTINSSSETYRKLVSISGALTADVQLKLTTAGLRATAGTTFVA